MAFRTATRINFTSSRHCPDHPHAHVLEKIKVGQGHTVITKGCEVCGCWLGETTLPVERHDLLPVHKAG